MAISVGDVLRVVAIMYWLDGNTVQNVFNAVITGSGGPFDDADIVDDAVAWMNSVYGNLTSLLSQDLDGAEVAVYEYDSVDEDWDEVGKASWSFAPTGTAGYLPRGVAGLINAGTTDPDVQGKKYLGGLTTSAISAGLLVAGTITALGNFADDWLTAFTGSVSGADWVPGIWSPKNANFFAADGNYTVPTIPAYQRRRKRGVGA
jgi:hypothetical protein